MASLTTENGGLPIGFVGVGVDNRANEMLVEMKSLTLIQTVNSEVFYQQMMTSLDPGGVGGYHLDHKCNRWQRFIDRNRDQRGRLLGLDPGVHHRNCKSYFFKDYFPCTDHCAGKGNKKRGSVGIRMRIIFFLGHPV